MFFFVWLFGVLNSESFFVVGFRGKSRSRVLFFVVDIISWLVVVVVFIF